MLAQYGARLLAGMVAELEVVQPDPHGEQLATPSLPSVLEEAKWQLAAVQRRMARGIGMQVRLCWVASPLVAMSPGRSLCPSCMACLAAPATTALVPRTQPAWPLRAHFCRRCHNARCCSACGSHAAIVGLWIDDLAAHLSGSITNSTRCAEGRDRI